MFFKYELRSSSNKLRYMSLIYSPANFVLSFSDVKTISNSLYVSIDKWLLLLLKVNALFEFELVFVFVVDIESVVAICP